MSYYIIVPEGAKFAIKYECGMRTAIRFRVYSKISVNRQTSAYAVLYPATTVNNIYS